MCTPSSDVKLVFTVYVDDLSKWANNDDTSVELTIN